MAGIRLALSPDLDAPRGMDRERESEIGRLIEAFYTAGRLDPLLGPIFETHVSDWDAHFATMRDFWSSAVDRSGRYAGRPLEAHRGLPDLTPAHFDRWLQLWETAVDETVRASETWPFKMLARKMAASMSKRLGVTGDLRKTSP